MTPTATNPEASTAAAQTGAAPLTAFVAPTTAAEFNTLGERLVPKACFKVEDLLFDFASSFIRPDMKDHLPELAGLRNDHKIQDPGGGGDIFPPLSIFGHADPVGTDDFNKVLSGRRATAFYAMLVRDTGMWETLFSTPVQDDKWGTRSIQTMLSTVQEPISIDGIAGDETAGAVRDFQSANGLKSDGDAGPLTRKALFQAYMDALCGPDLKLDKAKDFLARNEDGGQGKGDFQGCSRFNPLRVFSTSEAAEFAAAADKSERNQENAPNRRVVTLLFAPGRKVNPSFWPCPRAKEGVADCKKRLFPDEQVRRNPQAEHRDFEDTGDTFGCRFYQIISDDSPCERVKPVPPPPILLGVNPLILFAIAEPVLADVEAAAPRSSFVSAAAPATAAVTPLRDIVLVKKPYTKPQRVEIILKTDQPFDGNGQLSVNDPGIIRLFPSRISTTPLTYDSVDNLFSGARLNPAGPGVSLFAEGVKASATMGDFVMTLHLLGGSKKAGPNAVGRMTAIELTLDICAPRVDSSTAPIPLPQASAAPSATPNDKFFLGRPVPVQDDAKIQERAMLMVQPVKTAGFLARNLKLVLVSIGNNKTTFKQEVPSTSDVVVPTRQTLLSTATATTFFVEGGPKESANPRDNSYQLGIEGLDGDGDRVSITVVHAEIVSNRKPSDVHIVVRVEEKPARVTRSPFFAAPLIVGKDYPIEVRPFVQLAVPNAFAWIQRGGTVALKLTDTDKEVLKVKAPGVSGIQDDTLLQVRLTTNLGQFLYRHRFTVVQVTLDPVATGELFTLTDNINVIRNPAALVILTGSDAADTKLVAKIEMLDFAKATPQPLVPPVLGITPNLSWTDDDDRLSWWIIGDDGKPLTGDSKTLTGKADFRNDDSAKRGTKIEVFGVTEGDVLIQPYSGGFGYGMFRARVVPLRQVKYRINRISNIHVPAKPGKGAQQPHNPTGQHSDYLNHIKMTNVYLRQLGIQLIPDTSTDVATKKHATTDIVTIGTRATDQFVVSVTQATNAGAPLPGHFDVVVDQASMTFLAQDGGPTGAEGAIWINARNEVITFAYIHSLAVPRPKPGKPKSKLVTLAQAQFIPTNHAPHGKETDKGAPSSSLIPKTGIPPDLPAKDVVLSVIPLLFVAPTPQTPKNGERVRALLWGITVPTTTMDAFAINNSANAIPALMYGEVLAHEVGHVLGLRHRVPPGVKAEPAADGPDPFPDGQRVPREKNMMYPIIHDAAGQNFDIVQLKATRESVVLERKP
jgi:peptidoglycan hydrolase-like protein with peptidoglycan-binding domain